MHNHSPFIKTLNICFFILLPEQKHLMIILLIAAFLHSSFVTTEHMSKEDSRDSLLHDASFQDDLRTALKRAISARLPSATANSARRGQSPPPSSSSSGKSQQSLQAPQRKRKPEESYEDLLKSYNDLTSSKRCANFASKKKKKKNEVPSKDEEEKFGVCFPSYIVYFIMVPGYTSMHNPLVRFAFFTCILACIRDGFPPFFFTLLCM